MNIINLQICIFIPLTPFITWGHYNLELKSTYLAATNIFTAGVIVFCPLSSTQSNGICCSWKNKCQMCLSSPINIINGFTFTDYLNLWSQGRDIYFTNKILFHQPHLKEDTQNSLHSFTETIKLQKTSVVQLHQQKLLQERSPISKSTCSMMG